MIEALGDLMEQYTTALESYLTGSKEEALQQAYELGRKAIAEGVGVLELASVHNKSLATVLAHSLSRNEATLVAGQAAVFFAESLAPFEMVLRGYREANAQLRASLKQLEAAEQTLQRQNEELAAVYRMVEAERQRYQELFQFAPGGYLVTDLDGIIQEANKSAAKLVDTREELLAGKSLLHFVTEADRESLSDQLSKLRNGEVKAVEDWQIRVQVREAQVVPVSLQIEAVLDPEGNRIALRWLVSDITERKRIEEERAQLRIREHISRAETEAAQRLKFLAEASATLAASLDYETILTSIARLAVPYLAECCIVHLIEDLAMVQQVSVVHSDPEEAERAKRLRHYFSNQPMVPAPLAEVLSSSKPELIPVISETWLESFAGGAEPLQILRQFGIASVLSAPLIGQGGPLGTITFLRSKERLPYTATDRDLAEVFARRCSLVLDNARLHSQVVLERDKAARASRAKDEFVAILSHELRTPLTTILGWARILRKQTAIQNDPRLSEGVQALEHNARNVARLVEDCLDIARITERKIHLQKELVDINDVVKATLETTWEAASNKELHFLVHLSPASLWVLGDRTRLEQVVSNLLSNAFRYTGKGGLVSVNSLGIGQEAEISVQDTGIGIAPDLLEQIFQPFRQGTRHWLASESGLGLGLTIARQLVQMHGGRVWAESQGPGFGSTFRMRLPLTTAPAQSLSPGVGPVRVLETTKPLLVLFIEDSLDILNLMRIELEEVGFSVLTATDAKAGLELAQRERPWVIVSDIKMPGLDGYEFVRQLRQIPELASVPAIALTGFGMKGDVEKALAAGYNAHLCKPVDADQLVSLIRKFLPQ